MTDIRRRLIMAIEESELSQSEISRRAGQRHTWVGDLLQAWRGKGRRGRDPSLPTLRLLCQGLGISLRELLGDEILDRVDPPARPRDDAPPG